jgi:hypothetical protein
VIKVSRFILFFNLKHYLKDESKISSFTEKWPWSYVDN